jgi:hypothetical protein
VKAEKRAEELQGFYIHALATFGGVFGEDWKERTTAQLYERSQRAGR